MRSAKDIVDDVAKPYLDLVPDCVFTFDAGHAEKIIREAQSEIVQEMFLAGVRALDKEITGLEEDGVFIGPRGQANIHVAMQSAMLKLLKEIRDDG